MESFFKQIGKKYENDNSSYNQELEDMKRIFDEAGRRVPVSVPDKNEEWEKIQSKIADKSGRKKVLSLKQVVQLAASLLIFVAIGSVVYTQLIKPEVFYSLNEIKQIELPDGSEVMLNKNSQLAVNGMFNRFSRNVELQGEAYFKVTKAKHPFIVETTTAKVKVVGTEFNVKVFNKKVELAVNEGVVEFYNIKHPNNTERVSQGFLSKCNVNNLPTKPEKIIVDEYPGWMLGKLSFQNNSLAEICSELESSFNMIIEIENDSLSKKNITGTLDSSNPDEIMQILCILIKQNFRKEQGKYVIY